MMRKILTLLLLVLCITQAEAQRITRNYNDISLSKVLRDLNNASTRYEVSFIYNDLEDFRVTTSIRRQTLPDAVRQVVGFYPMRVTVGDSLITVECTHKTQRHLTGRLIDEQNQPVAYANIALFTLQDSTFLGGGVSNESGVFVIPYEQPKVLARLSLIGCKTIWRLCDREDLGTIRMEAEAYQLGAVTVKGSRPQYQVKGSSVVVNISGTILEQVHDSKDILVQIPGVTPTPDGLVEVFGRGAPTYYVNNRKVQDMQEVYRLSPKDIQSIELIRNPGARYDATVNAVIKITTRAKDNGWTLQAKATEKLNDVLTSEESVDVGLKKGGLNASAHLEYDDFRRHYEQPQKHELAVDGDTYVYERAQGRNREHQKAPSWSANVDYEFNTQHVAGVSYDGWHNTLLSPGEYMHTYSKNGNVFQRTHIDSDYRNDIDYAHVNTFYDAHWNTRLTSSLNLDYAGNKSDYRQLTSETTDGNMLSTLNKSRSRHHVYAGKLTFDYTLGSQASLSVGAEYNHVKGSGIAECDNTIVPSSDYDQTEDLAAAFAEAKATFGHWTLSGGLRYEYVATDYADRLAPDANVSRHYRNLFPSLEVSHQHGEWSNTLSFVSRTNRPSFRQLSNYTYYNNEFAYQHGNPMLQPMTLYVTEYSTAYRFINASLSYTYYDNFIFSDHYTENEHSPRIVSSFSNFDHASKLSANVGLHHNFKWWRPSLQLGVQHMFFDYEYMNEPYSYGKTEFYLVCNQYFSLPHSWLINAYYYYNTGGTQGNVQLKSYQTLNLSVQKSFLQDRLSVRVAASDLFHKMKFEEDQYLRNVHFWQIEDHKYWNFSLSVVYRLNQLKTKYRGNSAAKEQINRL